MDGDFAMLEGEVQGVLKALRRANINIVAIHNHMIGESRATCFSTTGASVPWRIWRRASRQHLPHNPETKQPGSR